MPAPRASSPPIRLSNLSNASEGERYQPLAVLGEGGGGRVELHFDHVSGREVALKTAGHASSDSLRREARIQAQLDHPAVVPVYDIGDDTSQTFFAMKVVRGPSLAAELEARAPSLASDPQGQWRLLAALRDASRGVEHAHERGVVHRDLKPANVMIGERGEAYVVDWGLALLTGEAVGDPSALVGTLGYLAPELLDDGSRASPQSDVYALGVMLHEILTGERPDETPLDRGPDHASVPAELATLCEEATHPDPARRLPSARALADRLDAFLMRVEEADRRRAEADAFAKEAEDAYRRSTSGDEATERAHAMRAVASALGAVPHHPDALRLLFTLVTEPPSELPDAVRRRTDERATARRRLVVAAAAVTYLSYVLHLPWILWMGVRSWSALGVAAACILGSAALAVRELRSGRTDRDEVPWVLLLATTAAGMACSTVLGSTILVPALAMGSCVGYLSAYGRRRWAVLVAAAAMVVVPVSLGALGWIPESYRFDADGLLVVPWMVDLDPLPTLLFLTLAQVIMIVAAGLFQMQLRSWWLRAEQALQAQKWQLEQAIPARVSPERE